MKLDKRKLILAFTFLFNLLMFLQLVNHRSEPASILGMYSPSYAAFLGIALLVLLFYLLLCFLQDPFYALLQRIPFKLIAFGSVLTGIALFLISSRGIDDDIKQFLAVNWVFLNAICFVSDKGHSQALRSCFIAWGLLIAFIGLILFLNALTTRPYSPDEAIWVDLASSLRVTGKMYTRSSYSEAFAVTPGVGWMNAIYAELQWLVDWDLRLGRLLNFLGYCLATLGFGWLTFLLYGRAAALIAVGISVTSGMFFRVADYRPDHFLPIIQSFSFVALLLARQSQSAWKKQLGHFSVGFIVTLGMQVHAAAVCFALGFSIFYGLEFIGKFWQTKNINRQLFAPIVFFGLGAGLGTLIYYFANIQVVGGLQIFLNDLLRARGTTARQFDYLFVWSLLEQVLLLASLAFALWRRQPQDKFYLALLACTMLGIFIGDTQGYIIPFRGLFLPLIGAFFIRFFFGARQNRYFLTMLSVFLLALSLQSWLTSFSSVQGIWQNQGIPEAPIEVIGRDVLAQLRPNDKVIVGTQELLWVMADHPNFYSPRAEGITMKERGWPADEVWQQLQPDLYIEILGRLSTPEGLQSYLETEGFQRCESIQSYGYEINFYRRSCHP